MNSSDAENGLERQLGANLGNVPGLIQVMHTAVRGSGRNPDHPAFATLAANDGAAWSLLDTIRTAVRDEATRLSAYRYLLPAVAHLKAITPAEVCELLRFLRIHSRSSPAWSLPDTLLSLFRRVPSLGVDSLKHAISTSDPLALPDIGALATALAIADAVAALSLFLSLAGLSTEPARLAVLRGVSALEDNGGSSSLEPHRDVLRTLAQDATATESTAVAAWELLCRLSSIDAVAANLVEQAAESGPKEAQIAISAWLAHVGDERWPNEALLRLVKGLLAAATRDAGVRPHVDHSVGMLLGVDTARDSIVEACDVLCDRAVQISVREEFRIIFDTLTSEPSLFSRVMTRWLLKDKIGVASLRSLLQHGFVAAELTVPDIAAFSAAETSQRVRAVRRLLGVSLSGSAICHFVFALATSQMQPWGLETFSEVLQNYVFVEFPHAAREFLDREARRTPRSSPVGKAIARLRRELAKWDKVLRELPEARELKPSEAERMALRLVKIREQREIHRQAKAHSVFMNFVTEFNAKQGSSVIMRIAGQPPQLIKMQIASHAFELPSSERSDPLWGQMQRVMYLQEAE